MFLYCLPLSGLIQQTTDLQYFYYFSQKIGFDISCKLSSKEKIRQIFQNAVC